MKKKLAQYLKKLRPGGIQTTLMLVVSCISLVTMLLMGILMYVRFSTLSRQETIESSRKLMEQTGESMEDYLVNMRQISDAIYYNVVKENDFHDAREEKMCIRDRFRMVH